MAAEIDSYKLGNIDVTISKTDHENKLMVICNDGNYKSDFSIRPYEYKNYKRHMNQRIKNAFRNKYKEKE